MSPSPTVVYVEEAVAEHARTQALLARLPKARIVPCRHYGEVFNRKAQDFRLQKRNPAWILGRKVGQAVLPAPPGYGVGGSSNFYFSHMLNCLYDCGYCFLQGMFRSANYLLFVNYEEIMAAIDRELETVPEGEAWFFSGYDCDSLAAEPLTGFAEAFLPFFAERPSAWLELRTKSVQIDALLAREPLPNCVVAFSFSPSEVLTSMERGVPSIARRLAAMSRLASRGWRLGLRFDPLIWSADFAERYERLFAELFAALPAAGIHSVSTGGFRLPRAFFRRMVKMSPQDRLLAGPLVEREGAIGYRRELEAEMIAGVTAMLSDYLPAERLFPCLPPPVSVSPSPQPAPSAITAGQ